MGGGLINFPTRFLRWVKIDADTGCDDGGEDGGDSTPTEVYIKFRAENFGLRDSDTVPDTVDRNKGYTLDEIFDMSGNVLEGFIKAQENARDELILDEYDGYIIGTIMGRYNAYHGLEDSLFNYCSYESGNIGSTDGQYPVISLGFMEDYGSGGYGAKTIMKIEASNLFGDSGTLPRIFFGKNDEDGKWYIVDAN